ncbi:O-antigen ligase family protein [Cupriavidus necator]
MRRNELSSAGWLRLVICLTLVLLSVQEAIVRALFPAFGYFDEGLILVLGAGTFAFALIRRRRVALLVYGAFFLLLGLSLAFGESRLGDAAIQMFIHFKFFILFLALYFLFFRERDRWMLSRVLDCIFVVSLIGIILNLLLGDRFLDFFQVPAQVRGGVVRALGFQLKPNDFAILTGLYALTMLSRESVRQHGIKFFSMAGFFLILVLLNGSRVGLFAVLLATVLFMPKRFRIAAVIFAIPAVLFAVVYFYSYVFFLFDETFKNVSQFGAIEATEYIRGIMIYYGVLLAYQNFPIGTGAGSFGSVMSSDSPVYSRLGLMSMHFFQDMEGVYDSNFATICGEFGVIGLIVFISLWFLVKRASLKGYSSVANGKVYLVAVTIFMLIVFLTNPLFMYQFNGMLFAMALIIGPIARMPKTQHHLANVRVNRGEAS